MVDFNQYSLDYFATEDGLRLSRVQPGGNGLPCGCYYNERTILKHFEKRLHEDLCPLLVFLEKCIMAEFVTGMQKVTYQSWIKGSTGQVSNIASIEHMCKEYISLHGLNGFECYLNIDVNEKDEVWGTQLSWYVDKSTWQDLNAIRDFPVWVVGMCGVYETVDSSISLEKMELIVNNVLEELRLSKEQAFQRRVT